MNYSVKLSYLNIQLTGNPASRLWTVLKSTEKQKWWDDAGTAIFCPVVDSEVLGCWVWEAGILVFKAANINTKFIFKKVLAFIPIKTSQSLYCCNSFK